MSNLGSLLKIEFGKFVSSFSNGRKKRTRPLLYVVLGIVIFAIAISTGYSWIILHSFVSAGMDPAPAISFFAGVTSLLVFMSAINQARGIYIGDDYDLLSSLPIRKHDIVASKVIALYLTELGFAALIMIPHAVMLIAMTQNVALFLTALLLAFTLPIVPIAIAVVVSLFITMATARFRYANIVITVFYTAFIAGISLLGILTRNQGAEESAGAFASIGGILKWVNPGYAFIDLAFSTSYFYLFAYAGVSILTVGFVILLFSLCFDKLHDIVASISYKPRTVRLDLKNKKETKILMGLEFKRLMASRIYFINAMMGAIMAIVSTIIYFISMQNGINGASAESQEEVRFIIKLILIPVFVVVSSMVLGLVSPATCGISIEGKNFWIIKSSPIDYKKYMHVKLLFPMLVFIPAAIVASTIAIIFEHDVWWDVVFAYLIPIAYVVFNTLVGLIINLHHPKLKWNSETEVVKNSAAVIIGLLLDFGIITIVGVPLIVVPLFTHTSLWVYIGVLAAMILASVPCYLYLRKNFGKKIEAIEDL